MARVVRSPFLFSGKVGDKVYRVRNGRMYVSRLPKHYKKSMDPGSLQRRNIFTYCIRLSSAIRKFDDLDYLWRKSYKRDYNINGRIFKVNYNRAVSGIVPELTPHHDFMYVVKEAGVPAVNFEITIGIPPQGIDTFHEPFLIGCLMLYYSDPAATGKNKHNFLPLNSEFVPVVFAEDIILKFSLTPLQLTEFNSCPIKKIYLALVTLGRNREPVKSSFTLFLV